MPKVAQGLRTAWNGLGPSPQHHQELSEEPRVPALASG